MSRSLSTGVVRRLDDEDEYKLNFIIMKAMHNAGHALTRTDKALKQDNLYTLTKEN